MESLKNIFKTKVGSLIAVAFVFAYIGLYYFKDVTQIPMDTPNSIIMIVIGFYFGSTSKENKE